MQKLNSTTDCYIFNSLKSIEIGEFSQIYPNLVFLNNPNSILESSNPTVSSIEILGIFGWCVVGMLCCCMIYDKIF